MTVDLRRDGAIARLMLNRPDKANALTAAILDELAAALEGLAGDAGLRAVVLGGAGKAFCGGADVDELARLDASSAGAFVGRIHRACAALRRLPVPAVARLQGAVIGAGLELAAACDLRIAASHARFGLPEIKVGIPTALDAALLQQYIGLGRTKEMILTGDFYGAEDMQKWGLLTEVVPVEELDAAVRKLLAKLMGNTRAVVAAQKRMFEVWQNHGIQTANEVSVDVWSAVFTQPETMESIARYKATHLTRKKTAA